MIHENYDGSPMHAGSFRKQRMLCIPQIHHGLMGLLTGSVEYLCYNVIMPMKCNLSQTCPSNHTYINTCANTYTHIHTETHTHTCTYKDTHTHSHKRSHSKGENSASRHVNSWLVGWLSLFRENGSRDFSDFLHRDRQ